jgi:hypothetical protein
MSPPARGTWPKLRQIPVLALVLLVWVVVPLVLAPGQAQNGNAEYSRKAEFLLTGVRKSEWPDRKMKTDSPFVIGVIGQDNISDFIREQCPKTVRGRTVEVKHLSALQEIAGCHVLFVSRSESARVDDIASAARRENVLTVGESENFLKEGGAVRVFVEGGMVRCEINAAAIRRARLKADSDWLAQFRPQDRPR